MAVLSTLLPTTGLIFAIQAAFAVPACIYATEKYYDLSGGLTFLAATGYAVCLPAIRSGVPLRAALAATGSLRPWNWRHIAMGGMISLWSMRLSSHLFSRIQKQGHDSRFDRIKTQPSKFSVAWFFQAVWVAVSLLPLSCLVAVPARAFSPLKTVGTTDALGLALWIGGMGFEAVADAQKARWVEGRRRKEHDEEFMTHGLWQTCRYPNYFGEVTLWTGAAMLAAGVMVRSPVLAALGWGGSPLARVAAAGLPFLCPAFSAFLLLKVSGVPLSEPKYDRKFGDREDYRKWRDNTPMFFPKLW